MLNTKIGIEIEFTGITRKKAAKIIAKHFSSEVESLGTYYDKYGVKDSRGRTWTVMYDGSIYTKKRECGEIVRASNLYSCELVTPILTYNEDIETLQQLIRELKSGGAFVDKGSCGIHIHLDGANHTPQSIRNFVNIIASKNDLLYKALQIQPERMRWCKQMDAALVNRFNSRKPKTFEKCEELWYANSMYDRSYHYNDTRYHFLNLHSFFNGNGTVELRGFNSTLHAGKVRAYIALAVALNNQALTQSRASCKKPQTENERFAMRTYLNRIGLIGDEFANCRDHLSAHLDGSAAWRYGRKAS